MSAAPRFSLRAAVTDSVSTGRREESLITEADLVPNPSTKAVLQPSSSAKTKRPTTRQGARGITVWVEPEVYRMIKIIGLDADMTTQDLMMEAINDLFIKKGKGNLAGRK